MPPSTSTSPPFISARFSPLEHFHERGEHLVRSQVMSDFGCSLKTSLHLISPSSLVRSLSDEMADGAWAANELSSMHFCPHSVHDAFAIWVDFQLSAVPPVLLKSTVTIFSLLLRCRRRLRRDMKWRETCHPLGPPAAPALPRYPITLLSPVASQRCFPSKILQHTPELGWSEITVVGAQLSTATETLSPA